MDLLLLSFRTRPLLLNRAATSLFERVSGSCVTRVLLLLCDTEDMMVSISLFVSLISPWPLSSSSLPFSIACLLPARQLLVFSITPFKINQNKNQNRSIDKVQNLGNERRYIYKDPRQDSGQRNISYTRYSKKCFTQTYRDLYGDTMLVLTWMSSNMVDGNQQKHLLPSFATRAWIYSSRNS